MGHHRAGPEHAEVVVGVAVAARPGAELLDPAALRGVLGQVALDGQVALVGDLGELCHELVGDARGEARRDDGARALVAALDLVKPAQGVGDGAGGVLLEVLAAVAVHVHLADVGGKPGCLELVHEQLGALHVQGSEDDGARRGALAQVVAEDGVGLLGIPEVGVVGLLGEGVGVQPVEQLEIHARAAEGVLRGVEVDVAHAGDDELVFALNDRQAGIALGQLLEDARAHAVDADGVAARHAADLLRGGVVTDVAVKDERLGFHGCSNRLGALAPL